MQVKQVFTSNIGGVEKMFYSKQKCEEYEKSLEDYSIIEFLAKEIVPNSRVELETMLIIYSITHGDNGWSGQPDITDIYKETVETFVDRYSGKINTLLRHIKDDMDFKNALLKYKTITEDYELDELYEKIYNRLTKLKKLVTYISSHPEILSKLNINIFNNIKI